MNGQLLGIVLLTFLLRSLPGILRFRNLFSGDLIYHLLWAEQIRKNKFHYPKKVKNFLLPGLYDYPPLFHYLLAFVTRKAREKLSLYFSAFIDSIHVVIIYFFTLYIVQAFQFFNSISNPHLISLVATLLFATAPALLYYNWGIGPRAYQATPRTIGELLITLSFFSLVIWYCQGGLWSFLLTGFFAGLALLTSKFSGQVLVFFSILLALLLKNPLLLIIPFLGVFFALILSKGYYYRVLVGWIKHSIFYKNVLAKNISVLTKRNTFSAFKNVFSGIIKRDFRTFAENLINIYANNTYVVLMTRNILLFALIFFSYSHFQLIIQNKFLFFLSLWILISLVVFFLTSLRPFLFLGEAERYLEYSVPAQVILFSFYYSFLNLDNFLIFLLIYHGLFYIANMAMLYLHFKFFLPSINSKKELFSWFNQRNFNGKKVLAIPANYYELIYGTDCAALYPPANFTLITKELYESLWEESGWHSRDIKRLIKNYDIDLIVIQKQSLESYASKKDWHYNLEPYRIIFENDFYCVYAV